MAGSLRTGPPQDAGRETPSRYPLRRLPFDFPQHLDFRDHGRVIGSQDVVLVVTDETVYPDQAPFDPSSRYPEYRFETIAEESNAVYGAVRQAFADAGLDQERFGTPGWNPLGSLMTSGEFVLVKPNLVKEAHPHDPDGWRYVLTHGSVIRARPVES